MSFLRRLAQLAAPLFLLSVGACGASSPPPKVTNVPELVRPTPLPAAAPEQSFQLPDTRLLCGASTSSGGVSLNKVAEQLRQDEADFQEKFDEVARFDKVKDCREAADALDNTFEQMQATSRSLCDVSFALGIGVNGEELIARNLDAASDVQGRLRAAAESKTLPTCQQALRGVRPPLAKWKEVRAQICSPTPAQRSVMACGVTASEESKKRAAQDVCRALQNGEAPRAATAKIVQECAGIAGVPERSSPRPSEAPSQTAREIAGAAALETAVLRGAADFFVERAEGELSLFAAEVVTARLCGETGVRHVLRNTCILLCAGNSTCADAAAEEGPVPLTPSPAAIREAARADLERLPIVLVEQIQDPALRCTSALSWGFASEVARGVDLLDLLADADAVLGTAAVSRACDASIVRDVRTLTLELKELFAKQNVNLPQVVRSGQFEQMLGARRSRSGAAELDEVGKVLAAVLGRVGQLDRANLARQKAPSPAADAQVLLAGLRTVEPILIFTLQRHRAAEFKHRASREVELALQLSAQILNHEYAAAVVTTAELGAGSALASATARNLLGLSASLAQANTSDDVRATLRDAALPLGSFRRKNERRWGSTLTGMVGFHGAGEFVVESLSQREVSSGVSLSPALLVGVDVHRGLGAGTRFGVHLNVLDLGAVASLRLDRPKVTAEDGGAPVDDTVESKPRVRIEQVFAPGLYPYFGAGPFNFGVGASLVPSLRTVNEADGDRRALNVVRVGGFVAVDVSVLPLL